MFKSSTVGLIMSLADRAHKNNSTTGVPQNTYPAAMQCAHRGIAAVVYHCTSAYTSRLQHYTALEDRVHMTYYLNELLAFSWMNSHK